MKKLIALASVVGLMALASPAYAQTAPTASVTSPGDGAVLAGSALVAGRGSASTGVQRLQLFIEGTLVATREPSNLQTTVDVDYSWNTNYFPNTSTLSRNGWYQILVRLTARGGGTRDAIRNVRVDNGAATPNGLSVSTDYQTVNLSWNPNPEPDIQAYRVEADSGSGFNTVGSTGSTSFSYTAEPGTYTWRVVALRSSPTDQGGKPSDPSATVGATVKAPPVPDSGSTGGGGGGTGGGGANGGPEKVFGGSNKEAKEYIRKTKNQFARLNFGGFSSAGLSLPGAAIGLPNLPDSDVLEWGTYRNKLPYKIPTGAQSVTETTPVNNLAAPTTTILLPMDALRWVAAGLLLVMIAMLLQFLATQAEKKQAETA